MSLYGDLPQAKDGDSGAAKGWAASAAAKKLQPSFRPKPAGALAPPSVLRGGRGRGPGPAPVGAGRGAGRAPAPAAAAAAAAAAAPGIIPALAAGPAAAAGATHSAFSFLASANGQPLQQEYDPARPNDYEQLAAARERRKAEAAATAEAVARAREAEAEAALRAREQAEAAAFVAAAAKPPPQQQQQPQPDGHDTAAEFAYQGLGSSGAAGLGSAAAADAATAAAAGSSSGGGGGGGVSAADMAAYEEERRRRLGASGEDAFRARGRISGANPAGVPPGPSQQQQQQQQQQPGDAGGPSPDGAAGAPAGGAKGMGLAQKLLEKMGWREGQGLGRFRQGMATPLVAQKTASNAGVIVNADSGGPPDKRPRLSGTALTGVPTRVVLLRNMVGPGEVDEDLEEEVGTECTRYGTVTDVMIFEVTTPDFPHEEAVRIFIQFDRPEAATRALVDLQGRFFGGRQVRAAFFSEERFEKQQLAPQAGEFGPS